MVTHHLVSTTVIFQLMLSMMTKTSQLFCQSKTFFDRDFQLICSQRSPSMDKAFSACCLPQGVKNRDQFPVEVVEAYKYTFSRPGALTGPINYYRAMFSSPKDSLPREKWTISVPTLIIIMGTSNLYKQSTKE